MLFRHLPQLSGEARQQSLRGAKCETNIKFYIFFFILLITATHGFINKAKKKKPATRWVVLAQNGQNKVWERRNFWLESDSPMPQS